MNRVVIGLGSNLNPEENILMARSVAAKTFHVVKESSFRKTKSLDHALAEEFLNGCIYIHTSLDLTDLRAELKRLERQMGRDPNAPLGSPHPIDFDVIVWNEKIIHPDFYKQPFLKEAVLELLPGLKF